MVIMEERFLNIFYLIYLKIFYNINSNHHNHSFDVNEKIFDRNIRNDWKSYYKIKLMLMTQSIEKYWWKWSHRFFKSSKGNIITYCIQKFQMNSFLIHSHMTTTWNFCFVIIKVAKWDCIGFCHSSYIYRTFNIHFISKQKKTLKIIK
jgi:hypothetical protein